MKNEEGGCRLKDYCFEMYVYKARSSTAETPGFTSRLLSTRCNMSTSTELWLNTVFRWTLDSMIRYFSRRNHVFIPFLAENRDCSLRYSEEDARADIRMPKLVFSWLKNAKKCHIFIFMSPQHWLRKLSQKTAVPLMSTGGSSSESGPR